MKRLLLFTSLLVCLHASSQDNTQFTWYTYEDSLHDGAEKDPNGRIFKNGQLEMKSEGKLYLYVASEQFSVYMLVKTPSGKWITREGKTVAKQFYKNPSFSYAELDTLLDENGMYTFYFTSLNPNTKGNFKVQLVYAPKESLYADINETDFCRQLDFLFKHAAIGFRFLRANAPKQKEDKGLLSYFYYNCFVPFEWYKDFHQRVERITSLDYYSYSAEIFFGSYSDCKAKFDILKEQLKKCVGGEFTIDENTTDKGNTIYMATIKDPDRFIVKTWAAWRKDVKYRFELSLYRYADDPNSARILLRVANLYEPME
jgi:hypothetical protein